MADGLKPKSASTASVCSPTSGTGASARPRGPGEPRRRLGVHQPVDVGEDRPGGQVRIGQHLVRREDGGDAGVGPGEDRRPLVARAAGDRRRHQRALPRPVGPVVLGVRRQLGREPEAASNSA